MNIHMRFDAVQFTLELSDPTTFKSFWLADRILFIGAGYLRFRRDCGRCMAVPAEAVGVARVTAAGSVGSGSRVRLLWERQGGLASLQPCSLTSDRKRNCEFGVWA